MFVSPHKAESLSTTHSLEPSLRQKTREAESLKCLASTAVTWLQGKWRVHILCTMRGGPVRLGQLSRCLPEASKKVLMTELKQLVASGLVERRDLSDGGVVRHVEYDLIESIRPATFFLLEQMEQWVRVWESTRRV
jgi:DNA-binding HxlR family transcriptional regulator